MPERWMVRHWRLLLVLAAFALVGVMWATPWTHASYGLIFAAALLASVAAVGGAS